MQVYRRAALPLDWQEPKHETFSFRASGNAFYKITPRSPARSPSIRISPTRRSICGRSTRRGSRCSSRRRAISSCRTRRRSSSAVAASRIGGRTEYLIRPKRDAVLLAQYRSGERTAREPHRRRETLGRIRRLRRRRAVRRDRRHRRHAAQPGSLGRADDAGPIGESKIGFIFTNGDPTGRSKNTVAGADFQYRNSDFCPARSCRPMSSTSAASRTRRATTTRSGWRVNYPNEPWGLDTRFKQIGTNFFPALGFVNRVGIRQFDGILQNLPAQLRGLALARRRDLLVLRHRPEKSPGVARERAYGRASISAPAIRSISKSSTISRTCPRPSTSPASFRFRLAAITGPTSTLFVQTSNARPTAARLDVMCCSFYNGDYLRVDLRTDVRLGALVADHSALHLHLYRPADRAPEHPRVHDRLHRQLHAGHAARQSGAIRQYQREISRSPCAIAGNTSRARNCSSRWAKRHSSPARNSSRARRKPSSAWATRSGFSDGTREGGSRSMLPRIGRRHDPKPKLLPRVGAPSMEARARSRTASRYPDGAPSCRRARPILASGLRPRPAD